MRYNPEIKELLLDETSFINYDASLSERLWYIQNNIHDQVKCPVCNNNSKIDIKLNKVKCCSFKCTCKQINPETGLTRAQEIGLKAKETNSKIDKKTGLTKYQLNSIKQKKTLSKINLETGLTVAQQRGIKCGKTLSKINPETGLTRTQEIGLKSKKSNLKIDPETGLNSYQKNGFDTMKKMKSKIDPITKLNIFELGLIKQKNTKSKIDPKTGLSGYQQIAIKIKKSNSKIDLKTGLTKIGKKHKINYFKKLIINFKNNYPDYILLTSLTEYLNKNHNLIKYQHDCGEIRIAHRQVNIRCLKCYPYNRSIAENEILEFCQSLTNNVISNNRQLISPLELDVYIPDHNLAIEYDGLYYHSFNSVESEDKDYHLLKTKLCMENEIQLFHIFENEWENVQKQKIWKSIIRNKLGQSKKIFARKCKIQKISSIKTKEFLDKNHLQGRCNSSINIGLFYNNELVSLMTFGKSRYNKKIEWELLRFCNKINYSVIGGASRLFKNFLKEHIGSIISYADIRHSDGGLYKNLGFEFEYISSPNYFYWKPNDLLVESRIKYQKHKLKNKLKEFDPNLTETENMYNNGYRKIFDCGNQVWIYN